MTSQNDAVRRSLGALRPEPDALDHPGHEALEAYVEGRATPAQRAEIDYLAAHSAIVAEDLADLQAVHQTLAVQPNARRDIRWGRVAAIAGLAASLVLGVWITRTPAPAPASSSQQAAAKLTPSEQATIDRAIASGRATMPDEIAALIKPDGTLLGTSGSNAIFSPLSPMGTAVRSSRPQFTWSDAGADAYTVAVFDESFTELTRSPRVGGTSWTPQTDLPRGKTYLWQVTAHRGERNETEPRPPRPEAKFVVITAPLLSNVEAMESRLTGEPLELGILLAEAGLVAEARVDLTRAVKIPGSAATARRLLDSLDPQAPPR